MKRMSRTLITGVDGFTGRYLAALLASKGDEVVGLTHMELAQPVPGLSASHACDLRDAAKLRAALVRFAPDKIVHLAAIAFVAHGDAENIYLTNVVGTRNLLEAATTVDGLETLLLASSANIYGNRVGGAIDETVPPDPINDYAVSKLAMEFVARLYQDRLPIVIARPFNYTGVGQSPDFVIPKIVSHVQRKSTVIELGNIDIARDFSDIRDVVKAYAALLDDPTAVGQVFNICSGEAQSLRTVIDVIRDLSGHAFDIEVNPAFVRNNEVEKLWGDRSKIEAMLGHAPRHSLRETLAWMLANDCCTD